ncbi:uncharacterized protein PAC_08915 [Phialocephala subalpina]|uniref:Uncharacterized protein n=1 Tax=Phialocephala subalpina TaxID=576137 RepID=A0A1L7X1X6_9HELO|nr:uncharacterized protein PAC_08915 [Phialocephala subalpina]
MAKTGKGNSQIMVRIRKLPTDGSQGAYYEEYAQPSDGSHELKITRHIVPEDGAYGIEVTLCKGYVSGEYGGGIGIKILDKATNKVLLEEGFTRQVFREPLKKPLSKTVKSLPDAVIDGQHKKGVRLMLYSLVPDEQLDNEADTKDTDPRGLGGIEVVIDRLSKPVLRNLSKQEYEGRFAAYKAQLEAPEDTMKAATAVDEVSFGKHGITHGTRLVGGITIKKHLTLSSRQQLTARVETRLYTFQCRAANYLVSHGMICVDTPIEQQSWEFLSAQQRKACLAELQSYDRHQAWQEEFARLPDYAHQTLRVQMSKDFEEAAKSVARWREWDTLSEQDREETFKLLQQRRKYRYFDAGRNAPTELPGYQTQADPSRQTSDPSAPVTVIKKKPGSSSSLSFRPKTLAPEPEIVSLLSDSEEEVNVRVGGRKRPAPGVGQPVIKREIKRESSMSFESPDIYNASPHGGSLETENADPGESPAKKAKVEDDTITIPKADMDAIMAELELLRKSKEN